MSLRARLLVVMLLVTTVGLLGADVATYQFLRSFLFDRVDAQLLGASQIASLALDPNRVGFDGPPTKLTDAPPPFPSGTYVAEIDPTGAVTAHRFFTLADDQPSPPVLPEHLPASLGAPEGRGFLMVTSADGSIRYRVLAVATASGAVVAAIPITEVSDTLHHLLLIAALVSVGVLVALTVMSWWLVRLGFRPLERMEETAGAIAAGDLTRRVEPATPRTEVGRLGVALNAMLERIETAFAERRASEERLRRFVADASHELRTPLTSLRGYAELFRRGAAERPADLRKAMSWIEEEGGRMADLVDELALLARLDEGRPLTLERRDLVALVRTAVDVALLTHRGRAIAVDAPSSLVADVDPAKYREVLDNLVSNALDHTPDAAGVLVRLRGETDAAVLEVEDEGDGVADEHADRVFERFYRADASRSRGTGGSGLGLSIVAAIAEAHGGEASYRRSPTGGALFRVTIPLTARTPEDGSAPVSGRPHD